jgi:hypothetical protein
VRSPVDVLVAIPAHDEATTIVACLESVVASLVEAQAADEVGRARVAVAAHRCSDDTADQARRSLAGRTGIESVVLVEQQPLPVGAVRTLLIRAAAASGQPLSPRAWILSTDADTLVPRSWVRGLLAAAGAGDADLVLGLAELDDWAVGDEARRTYASLIDGGIHDDRHDHVYAANLAVSWAAFTAVGGFPAVPHGEEHGLVRAVRAAGRHVVSPLWPRVRTSARMPGRATDGLGDLLARLAGSPVDVAVQPVAPARTSASAATATGQ